jgi:histidyl-tRNA synthetase
MRRFLFVFSNSGLNGIIYERKSMTKIEPRLLKGFRDFGPDRQVERQAMFAKIQTVFERFGFLPMATPVLEYKDILMGKYGDDEKLVYSFKDNGDRDVAMRYDLTVPLARFVALNQNYLTFPFKRYQIAPVWRADNTQKGRFREFYQADIDAVGTSAQLADAEVIACVCQALSAIGFSKYKLRLNDRRNFDMFGENSASIIRSIDKFDKVGMAGVVAELESKQVAPELIDTAKRFLEGSIELPKRAELEQLRSNIIALGVPEENIVIDPSIARGLDYYTSTVFEVIIPDLAEYGSVASGGRYDNLVDQFSNQSLAAMGGSLGIDRLFEALGETGNVAFQTLVKVIVINFDPNLEQQYLTMAARLRSEGINTELYYEPAKLEKQLRYAESKNIAHALIVGADEAAQGVVKLKDLQTRTQIECTFEEVIESLK